MGDFTVSIYKDIIFQMLPLDFHSLQALLLFLDTSRLLISIVKFFFKI